MRLAASGYQACTYQLLESYRPDGCFVYVGDGHQRLGSCVENLMGLSHFENQIRWGTKTVLIALGYIAGSFIPLRVMIVSVPAISISNKLPADPSAPNT